MLSSKKHFFCLPQCALFMVLLLALTGPLFAANVSFIVLESGKAASASRNTATIWEDGIMEVFFNNGHIISNAKSKKIPLFPKEELPEEALRDFQDADSGGSEYFMVALLNYSDDGSEEYATPKSVTIRIYAVSPYKFIAEKTMDDKNKSLGVGKNKNSADDALGNAKKLAGEIVWYIGRDM
jgi:hypothetical protein